MMHNYSHGPKDIRVGVVGGSGYAGLELVRLLQKHPRVLLRACFTTHPDFSFRDFCLRTPLDIRQYPPKGFFNFFIKNIINHLKQKNVPWQETFADDGDGDGGTI